MVGEKTAERNINTIGLGKEIGDDDRGDRRRNSTAMNNRGME
jgi:hypothetical protein